MDSLPFCVGGTNDNTISKGPLYSSPTPWFVRVQLTLTFSNLVCALYNRLTGHNRSVANTVCWQRVVRLAKPRNVLVHKVIFALIWTNNKYILPPFLPATLIWNRTNCHHHVLLLKEKILIVYDGTCIAIQIRDSFRKLWKLTSTQLSCSAKAHEKHSAFLGRKREKVPKIPEVNPVAFFLVRFYSRILLSSWWHMFRTLLAMLSKCDLRLSAVIHPIYFSHFLRGYFLSTILLIPLYENVIEFR